jgi:hypothetical protein
MLTYVHQQLMLSNTSSKVIARYITSSTIAITNVKCISSGARIRVTKARRRRRCIPKFTSNRSYSPLERCGGLMHSERHKDLTLRCGSTMLTKCHKGSPKDAEARYSPNATKAHLILLALSHKARCHNSLWDTWGRSPNPYKLGAISTT